MILSNTIYHRELKRFEGTCFLKNYLNVVQWIKGFHYEFFSSKWIVVKIGYEVENSSINKRYIMAMCASAQGVKPPILGGKKQNVEIREIDGKVNDK